MSEIVSIFLTDQVTFKAKMAKAVQGSQSPPPQTFK